MSQLLDLIKDLGLSEMDENSLKLRVNNKTRSVALFRDGKCVVRYDNLPMQGRTSAQMLFVIVLGYLFAAKLKIEPDNLYARATGANYQDLPLHCWYHHGSD
jgi:hypothetical protein